VVGRIERQHALRQPGDQLTAALPVVVGEGSKVPASELEQAVVGDARQQPGDAELLPAADLLAERRQGTALQARINAQWRHRSPSAMANWWPIITVSAGDGR